MYPRKWEPRSRSRRYRRAQLVITFLNRVKRASGFQANKRQVFPLGHIFCESVTIDKYLQIQLKLGMFTGIVGSIFLYNSGL